jgi:chaperonin GroES
MKQFKPLGNRVLIERSKAQTTKGGILLPDSAQEKPKEGTVIAVGPGKIDDEGKTITMNVKKGDRVLFSTYSGTEVSSTGDDVQYLIISEDDLLGIIEN